jgi:hypothetical protein
MDVQQQLDELKQRIDDLERARKQSVGPRGPQGPAGPVGNSGPQGRQGERGSDGLNGQNGRDGNTPSNEQLESLIASLFTEYHLLDENGLPYAGPWAKVS